MYILLLPFYLLVSPVLVLSLQSDSSVMEGDNAAICVTASFPAGGSDCNITVTLNVTDGTATSESMSL